jgi:hypothetical protein
LLNLRALLLARTGGINQLLFRPFMIFAVGVMRRGVSVEPGHNRIPSPSPSSSSLLNLARVPITRTNSFTFLFSRELFAPSKVF